MRGTGTGFRIVGDLTDHDEHILGMLGMTDEMIDYMAKTIKRGNLITDDLNKRFIKLNLKILKEIDRICRKYRIRYQLDAATLLVELVIKVLFPDHDAHIAMTRRIISFL